ncbi:MAG TPA: hypothetical protein VE954_17290 [Oligoflexus sp.]|uniref:hypothetical protein n=1 Tax=Oligoflexus sp. TaxID=1971216 RepID=UPI002D35F041|nr:hypothetical protein [Oligoflexus sp.]HYX34855.1 hypothetical protein [Oligoflexus sp.]
MQVFNSLMTIRLAALMLLFSAQSCTQKSFSLTEKSKSTSQAIALDPDTKANDRPTESGTGVPGYLVDCSPFNVQDDNVQVGCNTTTADGIRVMTSVDAWKSYDIRLPADAPFGVTITKTIATNLVAWDVHFTFRGSDRTTLSNVARNSIYGYTYPNSAGQTVRVETAPLPPAAPVAPPAAPTTTTTCLGGTMVDGHCFVPVEMSCTEYCAKGGLNPHPYIATRFGSGPDTDNDFNKQECHDLFVKIRGNENWDFGDTNGRGLGCFTESNGRVVYDRSDTNPFEFPRIGDRRICGCL